MRWSTPSIVPAIAVTVEDESGNPVTSSTNGNHDLDRRESWWIGPEWHRNRRRRAAVSRPSHISPSTAPGPGYTLTATVDRACHSDEHLVHHRSGHHRRVRVGEYRRERNLRRDHGRARVLLGNNINGQLGNSSTTNSTIPVQIVGGLTFRSMSVGSLEYFSCGLTTAGAAYCWGYNDYGQLGNATFTNSTVPVAVTGNLTFTSLSAGEGGHACALTSGGAAYCWGYNGAGQLGVAAVAYSSSPLPVSGGLSFTTISAGENGQTCAVAAGGAGDCWGSNTNGELGNGTTNNINTPTAVSGGLTFKSISVGFTSACGLTTAGAAYCWGDNTYGELGNGSTTNSSTPVAVGGGLIFQSLSVGDAFACGVTASSTVYCCGLQRRGAARHRLDQQKFDAGRRVRRAHVRLGQRGLLERVRGHARRRGLLLGRQRVRRAREPVSTAGVGAGAGGHAPVGSRV